MLLEIAQDVFRCPGPSLIEIGDSTLNRLVHLVLVPHVVTKRCIRELIEGTTGPVRDLAQIVLDVLVERHVLCGLPIPRL